MRKITSSDVARFAGVSRATVSRVLNGGPTLALVTDDKKQRVLEAIKRLDYHVNRSAKSLASNMSYNIGFALYDIRYLTLSVPAQMLAGIAIVVGENNYNLHLCTTCEEGVRKPDLNFMVRAKECIIDGFLINDNIVSVSSLLEVRELGIPIVLIQRYIPGTDIPYVILNHRKAFTDITNILIELGHKNIAYVTQQHYASWMIDIDQTGGYTDAMLSSGLSPQVILIDVPCAFEAALQNPNRPTALVFRENYCAEQVYPKLKSLGLRIPEDISITGFEEVRDSPAYIPNLTTTTYNYEHFGEVAAEMLFDLINGSRRKKWNEILEVKIEIRDSIAPPPIQRKYF